MSLLTLPPELLFLVASFLPAPSICALILTCRRLHHLLTPTLHRFIPVLRTFTHDSKAISCTLHWSVLRGHFGLFKLLLSIHPLNSTPCRRHESLPQSLLHFAAFGGSVGITRYLLDEGGLGGEINTRDVGVDGCTPLHLAVLGGHEDVVSLLLSRGAGVNIPDNREFPALLASHSSLTNTHWSPRIFTLLLSAGASINTRHGSLGTTALHEAVVRHNIAMVGILLDHGASTKIRRYSGETALELALYREDGVVVKYLQMRGLVKKLEGKYYDERPPVQVGFRGGVEYWRLACGKGWRNKLRAVFKALRESNPHAGEWALTEYDARAKARIARKGRRESRELRG